MSHWQTKTNKMVFSTEDLVLIKVLCQEKGYNNWWIITASLEITVNVHKSVLSRKLVFWMSNWKHIIKYDLYIKFPRIFAHNVRIYAKFSCKNFADVLPSILNTTALYLGGGVFSWIHCIYRAISEICLFDINIWITFSDIFMFLSRSSLFFDAAWCTTCNFNQK